MKIKIILLLSLILSLSACNTFKGVGEDIEGLGKGIQKTGS